MKQLEKQYNKNGYYFVQIERIADVAIYEQWLSGRLVGYEVFEIIKNRERVIAGKTIEASESTPGNEQWGAKGFTVHGISAANSKAAMLRSRVEDRKNRLTQQ